MLTLSVPFTFFPTLSVVQNDECATSAVAASPHSATRVRAAGLAIRMRRLARACASRALSECSASLTRLWVPIERHASSYASVDECLRDFVNHEKSGVPRGAGTDSGEGFDLGRMRRLLRDLGDPHVGYNTVHVSGTKGKGTTLSVLASVLRAAGLRVGTYKSPHVYTVAERIRSSDEDATAEVLEVLNGFGRSIKSAQQREGGQLSYFEVLTALAFAYFKKAKVDLALVEVGLGGSRDATNVLRPDNLEAAVITHIGEEHLEALGGSMQTIVDAKAGISHRGRPVFFAPNADESITRMLRGALEKRGADIIDSVTADLSLVRYHMSRTTATQEVNVEIKVNGTTEATLCNVRLPLVGPHQRENVALALRVLWWLRKMGRIDVSTGDICKGLETTRSPGNFEMFNVGTTTVIADGAHTKASSAMLVKTLREIFPDRNYAFVVGMADDKDHGGFLAEVYKANPVAVLCTQMEVAGGSLRTTPARTLLAAYSRFAERHHVPPEAVDDFGDAFKRALLQVKDGDIVVVTGSLYTFQALRNRLG